MKKMIFDMTEEEKKTLPFMAKKKSINFVGVHYVFKFENGYGASVVKGLYTYGGPQDLWELAVLKFQQDGEYYLVYDTEITNDVIGYLTGEDVLKLLGRIKALEKPVHNEN